MTVGHHQKKIAAFFLLVLSVNYFIGCKYYKPVMAEAYNDASKDSSLKQLNAQGRYFILRKGTHSYALSNVVLDDTKMSLSAKPDSIPPVHQVYLLNTNKKKYIYSKSKGERAVLQEVHIYTADTSQVNMDSVYTFPLSDVKKIEVIEFDQKKTNASVTKTVVFTALGAALAAVLIAAAATPPPQPAPDTISSCPYVSSFDGKSYNLQGEIYSGSIYQSLQRDDYLPLELFSTNGNYNIKISNELREIQHTDFADILVVGHDKNVKILVSPDGRLFSISAPQAPDIAILNNHIDVRNELIDKDNDNCVFKDDNGARAAEDLFITFKNESKSKRGKLILSGKTSSWVNHLFGEFTKGFGNRYEKWARQQEKKPAAELEKWSNEQNIPLTVSVKTPEGWKEIQKIKAIGPLLNRDVVIPVELPSDGPAEFKISAGYLFWELDYAAIDYSPDTDYTIKTIKPYEAVDEQGVDVLSTIASPDKQYLVQPDIWNVTTVKYKAITPAEGKQQTFFLHSSGYYTHIRHYKGSPKVAFLKSFEKPGALAAFSRQKFAEAMKSLAKK